MSTSPYIKWSGWAFILGAISFSAMLSNTDSLAFLGTVISSISLACGMFGLWNRYGDRAGRLGRGILLLGVSGPVLFGLILASMALIARTGKLSDAQLGDSGLWIVIFGAPVIPLLCLTIFGLSALRSKPMARWNWLPIFAGIWYPVVYTFLAGYLFTHDGHYPEQYQGTFQITFLIQVLALCALGAVLAGDAPQEMAPA